jgi:hypothetical protein
MLHRDALPLLSPLERGRLLALAGYLHPVMVKDVQSWLEALTSRHSFWDLGGNISVQL